MSHLLLILGYVEPMPRKTYCSLLKSKYFVKDTIQSTVCQHCMEKGYNGIHLGGKDLIEKFKPYISKPDANLLEERNYYKPFNIRASLV